MRNTNLKWETTEFSRLYVWPILVFFLLFYTGCGGGGGSEAGESGESDSSFIVWKGSSNGTVVLDSNNRRFSVRASDGAIFDISSASYLGGAKVDGQSNFIRSNSKIGSVVASAGVNATTIAAFGCATGGLMRIDSLAEGWIYTCPQQVQPSQENTGSVGVDPALLFETIEGSINGSLVLDATNDIFQVESTSRALYSSDTGILFQNTRIDSSGVFSVGGSIVGSIQLRPATGGGQVAMLICVNGASLDISLASTSGSLSCGSGSTPTHIATTPPRGQGVQATFTQRGEYITTTEPNQFRLTVTNTSQSNIYCSVFFEYQYPDGKGGLASDTRTNNLTVGRGSSNSTILALLQSRIIVNKYKTVCRPE